MHCFVICISPAVTICTRTGKHLSLLYLCFVSEYVHRIDAVVYPPIDSVQHVNLSLLNFSFCLFVYLCVLIHYCICICICICVLYFCVQLHVLQLMQCNVGIYQTRQETLITKCILPWWSSSGDHTLIIHSSFHFTQLFLQAKAPANWLNGCPFFNCLCS